MLIQFRVQNYFEEGVDKWNERKLSRVLTERAKSQSIASSTLAYKVPFILLRILTSLDSDFDHT